MTVLAASAIGTAVVAPAAHADGDVFTAAQPGKYTITVPKDVTEATVTMWGRRRPRRQRWPRRSRW
ncbi:hypothetical protein [Streptomyces sp. KL116D]|uniref:hypothetical protein n=1 Tax=Streptomyces sp. KL116D TaxID=3045152 RepID=UPI003558CD71